MTAPTLYFLTVTERITGGYEIWEQHMCQEKGCFKTQPEFITFAHTEDEAKKVINGWETNPPCGGIVEDVEWELRPSLPSIHPSQVTDEFCGTYSDLTEMVLSMAELSNLKAYRVIDDDGRLLRYTFKVVE